MSKIQGEPWLDDPSRHSYLVNCAERGAGCWYCGKSKREHTYVPPAPLVDLEGNFPAEMEGR